LLARKLPLLFERRITMVTRDQKYEVFRALHERPEAFVIPNPWNAGTARILTTLGFEALATTSAGYAFAVGRRDSAASLTRDEILENAKAIVEATHLPVSADLEDGFGRSPEMCATTIRLASDIGLLGGSIEDATGDPIVPSTSSNLRWSGSRRRQRRLTIVSSY
jgi:2-methylisocitrate lyase-like PEP mutase family enzyme